MLSFDAPQFLFGVLTGPVVAGLGWWANSRSRRSLALFSRRLLLQPVARHGGLAAVALGISLLFVTLAGPRSVDRREAGVRPPIDLMIALDCSRSMWAGDLSPNRLERGIREIKALLELLLARPLWSPGEARVFHEGTRVGLVLFSRRADLVCPLTHDLDVLVGFLEELDPRRLESGGSSLAAGLAAACDGLESAARPERGEVFPVAVIVSDGENRADALRLNDVAERARSLGVNLFALIVGTPEGARIPLPADAVVGARGRPGEMGRFLQSGGRPVLSQATNRWLVQPTAACGGGCFTTGELDFPMDALYAALVERLTGGERSFQGTGDRSLYQWFLLGALLCLACGVALPWQRVVTPAAAASAWPQAVAVALCGCVLAVLTASCDTPFGQSSARQGCRLFRAGDYAGARSAFEHALDRSPDDPSLLCNSGLAAYHLGDWRGAAHRFRKVPWQAEGSGSAAERAGRFGLGLCTLRLSCELLNEGELSGPATEMQKRLVRAAEELREAAAAYERLAGAGFHGIAARHNARLCRDLAAVLEERSTELAAADAYAGDERGEPDSGEPNDVRDAAGEGASGATTGAGAARGAPGEKERRGRTVPASWAPDPGPLSAAEHEDLFRRLEELAQGRREREAQRIRERGAEEIDW